MKPLKRYPETQAEVALLAETGERKLLTRCLSSIDAMTRGTKERHAARCWNVVESSRRPFANK